MHFFKIATRFIYRKEEVNKLIILNIFMFMLINIASFIFAKLNTEYNILSNLGLSANLDVLIKKHAIVGSGSVILPNTTLNDGVAIGALSLAQGEYESFSIYIGSPAEKKGRRRKTILDIEKKLMETLKTKNHFLWDGQSLDL